MSKFNKETRKPKITPNPEADEATDINDSTRLADEIQEVLISFLLGEDQILQALAILYEGYTKPQTDGLKQLACLNKIFAVDYDELSKEISSNGVSLMEEIAEIDKVSKTLQDELTLLRDREQMFLENEAERQRLLQTEHELSKELELTDLAIQQQEAAILNSIEQLCSEDSEYKEQTGLVNDLYQLKKKINNDLQEIRGNIRVYCRIRPMTEKERLMHPEKYYTVQNESALMLNVPRETLKSDNQKKEFKFNFQRVFDNASQEEVFNQLSQLIQSAIDGKNVCVFAYGQTGSGKTFTMEGTDGANEGVIPRSVSLIFDEIQKARNLGWTFILDASIVEVYMDSVRDLLNLGNLKEEPSSVEVTEAADIRRLLDIAHNNRKVAETSCNEHSSRSHCIFQLTLQAKNKQKSRKGTLSLIDLAGSERVNQSKVEGERMKETMSINKSLTQLSTVIIAIAKKNEHVPYRNSKLTHILQTYLSGDSKTLMIVMISPLVEHFNQTVCSLRFAETVTECIVKK